MDITSKYVRNLDEIVDDILLPISELDSEDGIERRIAAISEVLMRIPDRDYSKLASIIDEFHLFLPRPWENAKLQPLFGITEENGIAPYSRTLYLSVGLEHRGFDFCVACVAHELAHLVLDHTLFPIPEMIQKQEDEAWELVKDWGFEKEVKKHEAAWKRYYTLRSIREE